MTDLSVTYFDISGPALITPRRHGDARGYFCETWNPAAWAEAGLPAHDWVQDNEAFSATKGTTRGLHFQTPPHAQAKLIRAITGAIYDVAVDIRKGSPTYGKSLSAVLTAKDGTQLLVPRGFAHGYQTLTADTLVAYKCDNIYKAKAESGLLWSDTHLGIAWPQKAEITLSDKDTAWPTLANFDSPFKSTP